MNFPQAKSDSTSKVMCLRLGVDHIMVCGVVIVLGGAGGRGGSNGGDGGVETISKGHPNLRVSCKTN